MNHITSDKGKFVVDYQEYHTDTEVDFSITIDPEQLEAIVAKGISKVFGLQTSISVNNMVLFGSDGLLVVVVVVVVVFYCFCCCFCCCCCCCSSSSISIR